ncbi:MAG: hypothetical protein QXD95_06810 [Nitrososphaeria archaeon]
MPQIRCRRCGLTINLENRKEMDIHLITDAVKRGAETFTELLHTTGLPRKTLNLKLNELCRNGVLTKAKGVYQLNGYYRSKKSFTHLLIKASSNRRIRSLAILVILIVGFPTFSYVLANLFPATIYNAPEEPKILGTIMAVIEVRDVKDLWAWQALIMFNESELKFLEWKCGEAFDVEEPFKCPASELIPGCLLIGATLKENEPGFDIKGNSTLAFITFGYYVENPKPPQLVIEEFYSFKTELLNSELQEIPLTEKTLNLKVLP